MTRTKLPRKTRFYGIDIGISGFFFAVLSQRGRRSGPVGAHTRVDVLRRNVPHGAPPRHKRETTNKQNPRPTSVEQQPRGARTAYGEGRGLWRTLVPRAWGTCTERSRTRRHFSGDGCVQREARGDSFARFFCRGTQAGIVIWQHPRYKAKTTLRSPNRRLTGA